jgi:hypothetical protein
VNDGQPCDAAEREMDLYRNEVARITAERDQVRELLAEVLREVELGTLRTDTPVSAERTRACVAGYRKRGGLEW